MAGTEKKIGKRAFYRDRTMKFPDWEITSKGLVLPSQHHALWEFFDDFNGFQASGSGLDGWHLDEVNTGTYPVLADEAFGVFNGTPDNAQGDHFHYQWARDTTVHEIFKPAVGKRAWLATRFKVEDADQNYVVIGSHVTADDPWNSEPTDQFLFRTPPATLGDIEFAVGKTNSTEATISLGTLADDTYIRLVAFYDGADTCHAWRFDDSGNLTNSGYCSVTSSVQGDLLPDTELTVAFGMEANDTGTDLFSLDFIHLAMER